MNIKQPQTQLASLLAELTGGSEGLISSRLPEVKFLRSTLWPRSPLSHSL